MKFTVTIESDSDAPPALDPDLVALTDVELLERMVDDAGHYRDSDGEEWCTDCNTGVTCEDHVNDHYLADRYADLGWRLKQLLLEDS